jgi:hypothetical protein
MDDPLVGVFTGMKLAVTIMSGNPTAENLAKKILADMILLADLDRCDYCRVTVYESPENSAEEQL